MSADEKEYFKKGEKHQQTIFSPITFPFFDKTHFLIYIKTESEE